MKLLEKLMNLWPFVWRTTLRRATAILAERYESELKTQAFRAERRIEELQRAAQVIVADHVRVRHTRSEPHPAYRIELFIDNFMLDRARSDNGVNRLIQGALSNAIARAFVQGSPEEVGPEDDISDDKPLSAVDTL